MLRKRIIPVLLLKNENLIKTVQFKKYQYIGDPANTCRIFNELEVDELCFLDVFASLEKRPPNFKVLQEISDECFMPLSYGGGISTIEQVEKILKIGFEKVIFNSATFINSQLIIDCVKLFGSQAIVASIDVKKSFLGKNIICSHHGTKAYKTSVLNWVKILEEYGVGEILLTNIDKEGTWEGIDMDIVNLVSDNSRIPVIAHGGAGSKSDIQKVLESSNASAIALGSMVVFQKKGMGVLINTFYKQI